MKKSYFLICTIPLLSSCFTQSLAPIEFKSAAPAAVSGYSEHTEKAISSEQIVVKGDVRAQKPPKPVTGTMHTHHSPETQPAEKPIEVEKLTVEKPIKDKSLEEELNELGENEDELQPASDTPKPVTALEAPITVIEATNTEKFDMPVVGKIITKFGDLRAGKKSNGIDIETSSMEEIKSIADGTVVYSGVDTKFGNLVIVKLNDSDMFAAYAHMDDLILSQNDVISKNQLIGHVGSTGEAQKPQLHFALRKGKTPVDPMKYLKSL